MRTKYTPGCECCGNGLVFVPYCIQRRPLGPNFNGRDGSAQFDPVTGGQIVLSTDVFLNIYDKKGPLLKTIDLFSQEPYVTSLRYVYDNGARPFTDGGYGVAAIFACCTDNVVAVVCSFVYNRSSVSFSIWQPPNDPIVEYDVIHRICFYDYASDQILYNGALEVDDPTLIVDNACINKYAELYVGFAVDMLALQPNPAHYVQAGPNPQYVIHLKESDYYNDIVKPFISKDTVIKKIKYTGEELQTITVGRDPNGVFYKILDMFVDPNDRLLVCLKTGERAYRRDDGFYTEFYGQQITENAQYYWPDSCLKVFPGGQTYRVSKGPNTQPGLKVEMATSIYTACCSSDGTIFIGATGYSSENIYPDSYIDFPGDTDPIPAGIVSATNFDPYSSVFKHTGGTSGTYADWEMLFPRYNAISFINAEGKYYNTGMGKLRCSNNDTLYGTLVIRNGPFGPYSGYVFASSRPFTVQVPIDEEHNQPYFDTNHDIIMNKYWDGYLSPSTFLGATLNSYPQYIVEDYVQPLIDNTISEILTTVEGFASIFAGEIVRMTIKPFPYSDPIETNVVKNLIFGFNNHTFEKLPPSMPITVSYEYYGGYGLGTYRIPRLRQACASPGLAISMGD